MTMTEQDLEYRGHNMIYNLPNITYDSRSRVPEGYTELHWIESSGTQYIDSGVTTDNLRVELDMAYTSTSTNQYGGAGNVNYNRYNIPMLVSSSVLRVNMGDETALASITPDTNRHTFMLDSYQRKGGIDSSESLYSGSFSASSYNFYVLARNTGSAGNFISGRVYGLKMWKSGVSVRDYVPCINPQGEVGMYDTVSETFFGNSGSGVFIAGARVVQLPSGYTQLESITSDGSAYINTGITNGSSYLRYLTDMQGNATSSELRLAGSFNGSKASVLPYIGSDGALCINYGSVNVVAQYSYGYNTRHILDFIYDNGMTIKSFGSTIYTGSASTIIATLPIFLFCFNNNGSASGINKIKMSYFKLWTSASTLSWDGIPCLNPSNEVGMYDLVSQSFFGNSGSGSFTAGEVA